MTSERTIIESMFSIPDKDSRMDVPFKLNAEQAELDSNLTGRDIVPKARQLGVSTYILAQKLAKCLYLRNRNCVIISHEGKSTQRLLRHIHYMIKHMRGGLQPEIQYASKNEITFPKTDSAIYIGTAGSDNFGHGDTITDLHGSEVARWPDPASLLKGVFQAVPPSGCITLESTGNGQGNWYHRACMRAAQGIGYKLHFFNWLNRPEYRVSLSEDEARRFLENLDPELEEPEYHARGLTVEQLAWRRRKIQELDYDLQSFKEQFPVSLDECFQSTSRSWFKRVRHIPTGQWIKDGRWLHRLEGHPSPYLHYVLGVDVGGGVGKDASVGEVFCLETGEQVAELWADTLEPDVWGEKVYELATRFNDAYTNIERNNHGILTLKVLISKGYKRLHKGKLGAEVAKEYGRIADYGTFTSETTRMSAIGALRSVLSKGEWFIHSDLLKSELDSFGEQDNGKVKANEGCHDDRVLAAAMAAFVAPRAAGYFAARAVGQNTSFDPGSLDGIIAECERRYGGDGVAQYPIPAYVANDA